MYIDNLLIDKAEPNFIFADTQKKRDEVIEDLKAHLYKENFDKAFIAHKYPLFVLVVESKVGQILENGINENELKAELLHELQDEQLVDKALDKLCR